MSTGVTKHACIYGDNSEALTCAFCQVITEKSEMEFCTAPNPDSHIDWLPCILHIFVVHHPGLNSQNDVYVFHQSCYLKLYCQGPNVWWVFAFMGHHLWPMKIETEKHRTHCITYCMRSLYFAVLHVLNIFSYTKLCSCPGWHLISVHLSLLVEFRIHEALGSWTIVKMIQSQMIIVDPSQIISDLW